MKKNISLILAMIMVFAMGVSAFAEPFVGSVAPEFKVISAKVIDENGNIVETHGDTEDCMFVTHITESGDAPAIISEEIKFLVEVYRQLTAGTLSIPYAQYGHDPETSVLVDLYDITIPCEEHEEAIAPEGIHVEVVLEANVPAGAEVFVLSYKNGHWMPPAEEVINNGDGTITCVFEHFCPVAISVVDGTGSGIESNPSTGAPVAFGAVAVLAAAVCALFTRKK